MFKTGNKLAKEMTDELLKQANMEDNKENRDCQYLIIFVTSFNY